MSPQDLGRKSLLILAGNWSGSLLGMLVSVLVARQLGAQAVGAIGFSLGLAGIAMAVLLPGFAQAHLKRLAEGQDPGRCLGAMLAVQGGLTAVLCLLVLGTWKAGVLGVTDLTLVFVLVLSSQVATNLADVFLKVFLAREWVMPHAAILVGARVVRLVATVAVLVATPSTVAVAATYPIEGMVAGLAAAGILATRYGIRVRRPTLDTLRAYWRYARPLMLITPMALVQDSIDRVAVGWWAGLYAAGFYHVARALWEALSSLMAAPGVFLFTRLSGFYAARSETADAEARRFFFGGLDKLLFFSIPLAFLFWAFAEILVVALYGPAFLLAAMSLRILVLATVAANIVNPYTFVLYALEQVERLVPVNALRLVTYLAVLALLVPPLGLEGAALARLFLILFPAWVYFRWTRQVAGVPFYRRAWTYVGGFGLMLVVHHGLAELLGALGSTEPATTVMAAALTLLGYAGYLFRAHPDTAQNFRYAAGLLSPLRLAEFVRHSGR